MPIKGLGYNTIERDITANDLFSLTVLRSDQITENRLFGRLGKQIF